MTSAVTVACPCGRSGPWIRKTLALHMAEVHEIPAARALVLSQRILDGVPLPAEDLALFGVRVGVEGVAARRDALRVVAEGELPDDRALDAAVAAAGLKAQVAGDNGARHLEDAPIAEAAPGSTTAPARPSSLAPAAPRPSAPAPRRAAAAKPVTAPQETAMDVTCSTCGKKGHNARTCGRKKNAAAKAASRRKAGGRKPARRAAPAVVATISTGVADASARAAAELLIQRLEAIRARLDERIANVRDLLTIL